MSKLTNHEIKYTNPAYQQANFCIQKFSVPPVVPVKFGMESVPDPYCHVRQCSPWLEFFIKHLLSPALKSIVQTLRSSMPITKTINDYSAGIELKRMCP